MRRMTGAPGHWATQLRTTELGVRSSMRSVLPCAKKKQTMRWHDVVATALEVAGSRVVKPCRQQESTCAAWWSIGVCGLVWEADGLNPLRKNFALVRGMQLGGVAHIRCLHLPFCGASGSLHGRGWDS